MRAQNRFRSGRWSWGIAAVELALVLPMLIVFLTIPVFFARFCWHYTVAQKAAQDAARYLSAVPAQEMRSATLAPQAALIARMIADTELAEMHPGGGAPQVDVFCGTLPCSGLGARPLPTTVRVVVRMDFFDIFFGVVDVGRYGWPITADITMSYVGQ